MQFNTAVATALLSAGSALAQSASAPAAAPSGMVMVQTVQVGGANGELTFSPSDIQAAPGSMVQFQFWPMNHSVAQSSFSSPCQPISNTNSSVPSTLWSGFMPTQPGASMMATWTIMINDTAPIWLYCAQSSHCQKGMVAAINAVNSTGKTVSAYAQAAAGVAQSVIPGGAPAGNSSSGSAPAGSSGSSGSGSSGSGSSGSQPASGPASAGAPGSTGGAPAPASTTPAAAHNGANGLSFTPSTLALVGLLSAVASFVL